MISLRRLFVPVMLTACALLIALQWQAAAGLRGTEALADYFEISPYATMMVFLMWCGLPFFRPTQYRSHVPSKAAVAIFRDRWPLLLFPFLLTPIFNASYTIAKSSIPYLFGYHWEDYCAHLDQLLFGEDPWRITHAFIGPGATRALSIVYTVGWGALFVLMGPILNFYAKSDTALRFHTARMIIWFFGGVLAAAIFSSAGPAFAQYGDPQLGVKFVPLLHSLARLLPPDDVILASQAYLRETRGNGEVFRAGGISAMPSMHVATAALYICVAWRTRFRWAAVAFWMMIWVASVHFGYHYAVDGLAGSLIAWLAWLATAPSRATSVTRSHDARRSGQAPQPAFPLQGKGAAVSAS